MGVLYSNNQYINLQKEDIEELRQIYLRTFNSISRDLVRPVLVDHHRRLAAWISKFYPESFKRELKKQSTLGSVVNREYSPELQIEVLDLDVSELKEPILDLGCGSQGKLVMSLVRAGKDAVGLDRVIEKKADCLIEANWFEYDQGVERWGTVISNMSFTNHLIYTYANDPDHLYMFLLRFKEILESLQMQGRFYYAPSLPFIEERLDPDLYAVDRVKTDSGISRSIVCRLK